jgi:predicted nucleic acid-binding protein
VSLVIDASVAVAWLFRDERAELARRVLRKVVEDGATVPSLWRLEVANALRSAVRRQRCDEGYATRCLERLGRLPIAIDAETALHAWGPTRQLSIEHDLTLFDAAYLELAMRGKRPLASAASALITAARNMGLLYD